MKIIKVSSLPLVDVIKDIAKAFDINYTERCSLYEILLPPKIGKGYIRAIDFADGLGLITYNCVFNIDIQFAFSVDKVHPLKFLFCIRGAIEHRFSNEDIDHVIPQLKNAIVASSSHNGHIIKFTKGVYTQFQSLELDRARFRPKIACNMKNLARNLQLLLNDVNARQTFYYDGFYSLELANQFNAWNESRKSDFIKIILLEGIAFKIMALNLLQYEDDLKSDGKKSLLRKSEIRQVGEAIAYIDEHISNLPTVKALGHEVGLGTRKLQEGFKELLGMSVNGYIQKRRLELASTLVMRSEKPLAQIASDMGYQSFSYLSKKFRESYGISPSSYRKKAKEI